MNQQQQQRVNEAAEEFTSALIDSYRGVSERGVAAQERGARLTEDFFNRVVENLRSQVQENQQLAQQLSDQQQRQREATQALTQKSVNAYMEFVDSIFSYWQGNAERDRSRTASAESSKKAIELLDEWIADDSGYDEESWPELKVSLNRDRLSDRKLFVD